jgi:hypothetical protein
MQSLLSLSIAFALLGFIRPAAAQDDGPLTQDRVEHWISALEELDEWSDGQNLDQDLLKRSDAGKAAAMQEPFTAALEAMANLDEYDEVIDILESNGFNDPSSWALTGNRIVRAYASLRLASEQADVDEEIQKALDGIEASGMSEEQKEAMRQMLMASAEAMESYSNAPKEDQRALEPYLERLERLFENQ